MKKIPYSKFKHGQRVTCEIEGDKINDAKISIDNSGIVYILVNIKDGGVADDLLGYEYCWKILSKNEDFYDGKEDVKNLKFLPRTIDDLEEGDLIGDECGVVVKVLGICGKVCFLSEHDDFRTVDAAPYTLNELKEYGYTLKQDVEEPANMDVRTPTEEEREAINNPILSINPDETEITYKGKIYILSK